METVDSLDFYQYTSLIHSSSVRLLQLQPSDSSDAPLCGELVEVRLEDKVEFEALSYAWGEDQSQPCSILVDGSRFAISETLSSALHIFRLSYRSRKIWIDAICINQQDIKERSSQVAHMSTIYQSAIKILVWLGESTEWTEEALQYLRDVAGSDHGKNFRDPVAGPSWFSFGSRTLSGKHEDIMKIIDGTAKPRLDDIFSRPWFTRLWVIQEIALAKTATLYCGQYTIEWAEFSLSLSILRAAMNTTEIGIAYLGTFQKAWPVIDVKATLRVTQHTFFRSPYNELSHFLTKIKDQRCKDDRDQIYGLLGLGLFHLSRDITRNGTTSSIVPDYTKSKAQVYMNVAKHFLMQGDLYILHHAGLWRRLSPRAGFSVEDYETELPPENLDYLPSWVPEFNNSKSFDKIPWYCDDFHAGLGTRLVRATVEPHTPFRINLRGKIIGIVARRIGVPDLQNSSSLFDSVCNLVKDCLAAFEREGSGGGMWGILDFPATLMGGGAVLSLKMDNDFKGRLPITDIFLMWQLFQNHCLRKEGEVRKVIFECAKESASVSSNQVKEKLSEEGKKAFIFYNALCDVFEQFQFMITSNGRIGLIPLVAGLNDVISLFPGQPTPYILRRVKDRNDAVVIGPCYLHGIMDGEVAESIEQWNSVWLI